MPNNSSFYCAFFGSTNTKTNSNPTTNPSKEDKMVVKIAKICTETTTGLNLDA